MKPKCIELKITNLYFKLHLNKPVQEALITMFRYLPELCTFIT